MSTTCYNIQIPEFLPQRMHASLGSKQTLGHEKCTNLFRGTTSRKEPRCKK